MTPPETQYLYDLLAIAIIASMLLVAIAGAGIIARELIEDAKHSRLKTGFLKPMPKPSTKDTHTRKARKLPGAAA